MADAGQTVGDALMSGGHVASEGWSACMDEGAQRSDSGADRHAVPLVSVLVPVYNAERDLLRCLRSIAAMAYREIEVLMLDDGSTDGSAAICMAMAAEDPRFRYVPCAHGGVSRTRNRGLAEARGTYVQFVDADDLVHPAFLTRMLAATRTDERTLVICDFIQEYANGAGEIRHYAVSPGEYTRRAYIPHIMTAPASFYVGVLWNKLYRRDMIKALGMRFDEETSLGEDFLFNLTYLRYVDRICCIRDQLYYYELQRTNSLTSNRGDLDTYTANRIHLYRGYEAMFEAERMRGIWRFRAQRYMVDQYYEALRQWQAAGTPLQPVIYERYIPDCGISRVSFLVWTIRRQIRKYVHALQGH